MSKPRSEKGHDKRYDYRRKHFPILDSQVKSLLDQGYTTNQITEHLGLSRTCIQESRARLRESHEYIIPIEKTSNHYNHLIYKVMTFKKWLFNSENHDKDPCLKWIEVFGDT